MNSENRVTKRAATRTTPAREGSRVKKGKKQPPHKGKTIVAVFCVMAVIIVAALAAALPIVASKAPATALVKIPREATPEMLTDTLAKYFGADYASDVARMVRLSGRDLSTRHGAYLIEEGTIAAKAQRIITHGAQTPVRLTINGFRNFDEMCQRISRKFDFTTEELKKAALNPDMLGSHGLTPSQAMALWIDDTYEFYWTDTPERILRKIGANYTRLWSDANVAKAEAMGRTPAEIMTVASIADEETNRADEKGRIGRLYINRLDKGMRLQADPTVRFALGDFTIRRVKGEHLNVASPYNTYRVKGLPPGPIRTTSASTVTAILDSPQSDDIYMCAREDFSGYHNFASDYATHMENARRYQKALDEKGIQ